jgi:hypothetical protein
LLPDLICFHYYSEHVGSGLRDFVYGGLFLFAETDNPLARFSKRGTSPVAQKRGGVVEECCFSSCSYENLLLYCSQVRQNPGAKRVFV